MSRFDECYPLVLAEELGYAHHRHDSGGSTLNGVTQGRYDRYRERLGLPKRSVREMPQDEQENVYLEDWTDAKCDLMPEPLDLLVFDVAINSGPAKAIVLLQRALGMELQHHTGYFGPITTQKLADAVEQDGVFGVCDKYLAERIKFYNNRVWLDPTQATFLRGWMNRVQHMAKHIGLNERNYA